MTTLYLVRHGETDWNDAGRIQGSTDIPLNETGRGQAAAAGELLARRPIDLVVSSALGRAVETGAIIARRIGVPAPEPVAALNERHYGEAEGLTNDEVHDRFPDGAVPGRESRGQLAERVLPALLAIAAEHEGASIVVATHGGVIRAVLEVVAPDDESHAGRRVTNGSINTFVVDDGALRLIAFDDRLEEESLAHATDDLAEQNALETPA